MTIPFYLFPVPIRKAVNQLSIHGKSKIIGSASIRGQLYNSDYDVNSTVTESSIRIVINHIKNLYIHQQGIYITEFKCGFRNDEGLLWSKEQIMKERNGNLTLADALMQRKRGKNTCKIESIVVNGYRLEDINAVIFIKIGKKQNYYDKTDVKASLEQQVNEYSKDNSMKSLKRLYSVYKLENNTQKMHELDTFFNSMYGLLNKCISDLNIIEKAKPFVPKFLIERNLQMVRYTLAKIPFVPLHASKEELLTILNKASKQFLKTII